jgi:hypothetical protein
MHGGKLKVVVKNKNRRVVKYYLRSGKVLGTARIGTDSLGSAVGKHARGGAYHPDSPRIHARGDVAGNREKGNP